MKIRALLVILLTLACAGAYAQDGGVKGKVVSRDGRVALSNVKVVVEPLGVTVMTDNHGNFNIDQLPKGEYWLKFEAPEFENLDLAVRVDKMVKNLNSVVMAPDVQYVIDDAVFAEFDSDTAADGQSLPSSLSSSKDVFNNIASYKFSEMRFNVRGYDSQYSSIYLNGIRFNDAMTGYGPWSLWSGLNDATRNQENTAGLRSSGYGIDGIGGTTNVNARASQMRKGFRASVVNGNSMYRFRAMVSYASGLLDNGWSYAFSFSTRQGGNSYVDGVYYNAYGYFASVEKRFGGDRHNLALTILGAPTERGAQQASTQEAYDLLSNNYYNPNVGKQDGKLRNSRVRDYHEPIVMLNYGFDISSNTKLAAAASFRFGKNGYSALTWTDGPDPRPDYYRYLPSFYTNRILQLSEGIESSDLGTYNDLALRSMREWITDPSKSQMDYDNMFRMNYNRNKSGASGIYMIEERHTDQRDFNFAANIAHTFRNQSVLRGGLTARINRTEYYDQVKDLLGADYWLDVDKFALRDIAAGENVVKYGYPIGHATKDVPQGGWIHTHNLKTNLRDDLEYTYAPKVYDVGCPKRDVRVMGYLRGNDTMGIRNELWIVPSVGCVNGQAQAIAERVKRECDCSHLDDVRVYTHNYGCSQLGDDHANTQRALAALVRHPNAGAVLVLGLGCENNQVSALKEVIGQWDDERVKFLVAQEVEDEIEAGFEICRGLVEKTKADKRQPLPLAYLKVGLKCGGSDGFSGITANPLVGLFSDWLIAQGGTTVLTEVPEMFGAETILMDRAADRRVFDGTVSLINDFKRYFRRFDQPIYENPSPGNKKGGITTLEEKSLGCVQKGGAQPVVDVLTYAQPVTKPGLNLLQAPGNDLVAASALALSGCQLVLFTTGRGTPFGSFVPTMKISTNTQLAEFKANWIDFNAGTLVEDEEPQAVLERFIGKVLATAGGERLKHEETGFKEIAIFKTGVTL